MMGRHRRFGRTSPRRRAIRVGATFYRDRMDGSLQDHLRADDQAGGRCGNPRQRRRRLSEDVDRSSGGAAPPEWTDSNVVRVLV
jgi:hypothetical protein